MPSSPPVRAESCEARIWKNAATASVIMEKKMARTRRLISPIASAITSDSPSAMALPVARPPQPGPRRAMAMPTP